MDYKSAQQGLQIVTAYYKSGQGLQIGAEHDVPTIYA